MLRTLMQHEVTTNQALTPPHGRPRAPAAALRNVQAQEATLLLAALCSAASEQRRSRRTHGVLSQPRGGGRPSEREPRGRPCPAHRRASGTKECKSRMLLRNGLAGSLCFFFAMYLYLLPRKLFRDTALPPPSTCSAAEPTHPTAAQGHNELAYKCWYAQLDAYSNAATVILAGERRRHSVDSRIAMRRTACPDARLGALLWCRRKASGRAAQARPSG